MSCAHVHYATRCSCGCTSHTSPRPACANTWPLLHIHSMKLFMCFTRSVTTQVHCVARQTLPLRQVRQRIATEIPRRRDVVAHGFKGPAGTAVPLVLDTDNRNNRAQVEPRFFTPQCRLQSAAPQTHARFPQVAKAGTLTVCL